MIPDLALTRAGDTVTSLEPHKGLIRGTVVVGQRQDGESMVVDEKVARRFWAKVDKRADDECWPWTGSSDDRGYGLLRIDGKYRRASAVSLAIHKGPPPAGKPFACHSCDNPPCVNPVHLWWGSPKDNMQDSASKGRNAMQQLTHCAKGHAFEGYNLIQTKRGRVCRTCYNAYKRRRKQERKLERPPASKLPRPPKTHWQCGHARTAENTVWRGGERCRICRMASDRRACARYRAKKRNPDGRMSPGRDGEHDLEMG